MRKTRLFLASPSDVGLEREAMNGVVGSINRDVGDLLEQELELLSWETHAAPGAGRPQQVVFDDLGNYDLFVGLMWRRFGTPSKRGESGTVEEYRNAYSRWEQDSAFPLLFYFCEQPFYTSSLEEVEQFRRVLEFRAELEGKQLAWKYPNHDAFPEAVRGHLIQRLKRLKSGRSSRKPPTPEDHQTMALLRDLWPSLDDTARQAFAAAYNSNRTVGDGGIKTQDLFESLDVFADGTARRIIDAVPDEAMPDPLAARLDDSPYLLNEPGWFSPCVTDSLKALAPKAKEGHQLSAGDFFVDLAKHGKGGSVRRLREHHVGAAEIDALVRSSGATILAR